MPKRNPQPFSIDELQTAFLYNSETGFLKRLVASRSDFLGDKEGVSNSIAYRGVHMRKTSLIWALHYGYWPTLLIDHRDGDNQNNKLDNLREATHQQNQFNKVSFGKYPKGVVFKADANRAKPWSARIRIDGKKIAIGSYYTMEEAAEAYREAADKYQKEFAFHNSMKDRKDA